VFMFLGYRLKFEFLRSRNLHLDFSVTKTIYNDRKTLQGGDTLFVPFKNIIKIDDVLFIF
jgi:hypothetical protein